MLLHIVDFIFTVGLTLGVGSSTFALIFFIRALQDGVIDASEKRFMHSVYAVLRIGMVLSLIGLIGHALYSAYSLQLGLQLTLLAFITTNAVLMTKRLMPMRYGPVLAGGSWYSLFIVTQTDIASLGLWFAFIGYIVFLAIFFNVLEYLKRRFKIGRAHV